MPGRWAAPPAPAMITSRPRASARGGVLEQQVGRAVGGDTRTSNGTPSCLERLGGVAHRLPVGLGAHDDADSRCIHRAHTTGVYGAGPPDPGEAPSTRSSATKATPAAREGTVAATRSIPDTLSDGPNLAPSSSPSAPTPNGPATAFPTAPGAPGFASSQPTPPVPAATSTPTAIPAVSTAPTPVVTPSPASPTPAPTPRSTPPPSPSSPPPTADPTPAPTPAPTPDPTPAPTPDPTPAPTPAPTPEPTPDPTPAPTPDPTPAPTPDPTPAPTPEPTPDPTPAPTPEPTPTPPPSRRQRRRPGSHASADPTGVAPDAATRQVRPHR